MKKILAFTLVLCLLCACSPKTTPEATTVSTQTQQNESSEPPAETQTAEAESDAFRAVFPDASDTILAAIYNAPFPNGALEPTVVWNEGEYDKLYIIPRYPGMTITAWQTSMDEEGRFTNADEASFTTASTENCVIAASLERPEGGPCWYVSAETPDGRRGGLYLNYNGRYGTPVYEFLEDPYASALIETPTAMEDWAPQIDLLGYEKFWSFWRAAQRQGLDTWDAVTTCYSELAEIGDGAAFTKTAGGDMENGRCTLELARFHSVYYEEGETLAAEVAAQYALYEKIGNEKNILGPETDVERSDALYYRLQGLSIYNPSLAARSVQLRVNGEALGSFELTQGDFWTLIPLDLPDCAADRPITVEVEIVSTNFGNPSEAIIEVHGGLASNISGAL